jgi:hypothetical protein
VRYANTTSGRRSTVIVQVWTDIAHPPFPEVLVALASSHLRVVADGALAGGVRVSAGVRACVVLS